MAAQQHHHQQQQHDMHDPYAYANEQPYQQAAGPSAHPLDGNNNNSYGYNAHAAQHPPHHMQAYAREYEEEEPFDINAIDPALRLRTTKTAHSVIAESIRSEDLLNRKRSRFFSRRRRGDKDKGSLFGTKKKGSSNSTGAPDTSPSIGDGGPLLPPVPGSEFGAPESSRASQSSTTAPAPPVVAETPLDHGLGKKKKKPMPRRSIYVNQALPMDQIDHKGEPIVRYARNKVRTSKYTLITFIPRNLFEQFHRVANIYFLALVILQLFPMFGAAAPQIAMLPLLAIIGMTAIKDAAEDWRRARLDEEVNTSAATKLGNWKNVNQPTDPRNWFARVFNIGPNPNKASKGVRKLREAEAKAGKQIVMEHQNKEGVEEVADTPNLHVPGQSYPLKEIPSNDSSLPINLPYRPRSQSFASSAPSMASHKSVGVIDYGRSTPGSAQWERTLWKKLEVGDLVLLRSDEQIPADCIVLASSDADGLAFVETKNLDGETNLKVRKSIKATSGIKSEEDLEHAYFYLDSEPPNANLYSYNGVLHYTPVSNGRQGKEQIEAVTINEMLLRGCTVRNTKWVIGLVVYTGADTKIMMNGGDTPSKRSKIEKETNFNVIMNFIILMILCLTSALLHGYYRSLQNTSAQWYEIDAEASNNIYIDSLIIFVSSLIVFQNIVPISLYITIELVKTIQAYFIYSDIEMYYAPLDTPCVPKSWNISDDLGQIEYIFSDKTGTLTQNIMEFKKCSVQGVSFGEGVTEAMIGAAKREGRDIISLEDQEEELAEFKESMVSTLKRAVKNRYMREDKLTLIAPDLAKRIADTADPLRPHIVAFFRALALCHSVLSDKPEPEKQPFVLDYKAESPDEEALVACARDIGFPFVTRNTHKIDIEVLGQPERWVPLRVLEFNSTRKRMSVVVRSPEGKIILYCKGADSVIYERLAKDQDEEIKNATLKDLENFANGGLRTLLIAYREMSEQEFESWSKEYDAASSAVTDRENKIDDAAALIEHDLYILGATALEDKLQEGVPDAIAQLHKAGIKLWILTGDKPQTAIEIGYSCNLLTNDMDVMILSADNAETARAQIEAGLNKIASVVGPPPTPKSNKIVTQTMDPSATFAIVIDGNTLRYALQPDIKGLFLELGTQCSAVVCCRVSPAQKAQMVKLVKEGCNAMTLSIGDGANDVAMIQEANVGVGLFGLEGSQAAMSADYAFGQFRFLTRLLLVHGRWSYIRIADMHANFFYKNVIWTVAMFWFLIFSSFEATYLFQYTFVLLYNLIFTSLAVGILGAFDQDTNAAASMAFPQLYKRGIKGLDYTRARFWMYMLDGLYQSAVIFFIPFLVYWDGTTWSSTGRDTNDLYDLSSAIAAAGVTAANLYVGINLRYWTIIPAIVIPLSILSVYIWIAIWSAWGALDYYYVASIIFPTFNYWAAVVFSVMLAVAPRWLFKAFRQSYMPLDRDIIREAWVAGDLKDQLGIRHRKKRRRRHPGDAEMAAQYSPHYSKSRQQFQAPAGPSTPVPFSAEQPLLSQRGWASPARTESPTGSGQRVAPPPLVIHEAPTQDFPLPAPHGHQARPYSNYSYTSPSVLDGLRSPTYSGEGSPTHSPPSFSPTGATHYGSMTAGVPPPRPARQPQQPSPLMETLHGGPNQSQETFTLGPVPRGRPTPQRSPILQTVNAPDAYTQDRSGQYPPNYAPNRYPNPNNATARPASRHQDFSADTEWDAADGQRPQSTVDPYTGYAV
ncbi:phospholipid transporting ATPase [Vanrija albida]|uniref:Phospholipid-transporting ATPase n=1 Tax=Vanrija albida TaxID=181172 RepID=A0ABR3Q1D5_9TREE